MNKNILIMDDNCIERKAMSVSLSQSGYCVESVSTTESVLIKYHNSPRPDLLIIDNDFGPYEITGLDILRHLDHKVPVIMYTTNDAIQAFAFSRGVCRFLVKGEGVIPLVECVNSVLLKQASLVG